MESTGRRGVIENVGAPALGGAALLLALGGAWWWRRRRFAGLPGSVEPEIGGIDEAPPPSVRLPVPDFTGPLGKELQHAKEQGWDVLFAAAEASHGLPPGILSAVASRETNMKDIVGDGGHGRGLMQIDDRSHGPFLRAHGAGESGKPEVGAAIDYAGGLLETALAYGREHGVAEADLLKFALSSYNAGPGKALPAYKNGDSDRATTGKDYGKDVLRRWRDMFPAQGEPVIAGWIAGQTSEPFPAGLAPALRTLIQQVNELWPNRSTASDGTIPGSDEPDHVAGDAVDITADPAHGPDLRELAEVLLSDGRTKYVIFDAKIAYRDLHAGAWRDYPERDEGESLSAYADRAKAYNRHSRHLHLSIRQSGRADASPWPKGAPEALGRAEPRTPAPPVASDHRLSALLKRGILGAWNDGLVDNFRWVPLRIGPYEIEVTADAASVHGLRMPASFEEILTMAGSVRDIIPPTRAIVDARWSNATRKIVVPPIAGGAKRADGSDPAGVAQVAQWHEKLGPISEGALVDGAWKEWILEPGLEPRRPVNYGLRGKDGDPNAVWQSPGHAHDSRWKDYSQLVGFVKREGKKNGQKVDLLDELAKGGPLGGPLPAWIIDRLNGGAANA